MPTAGEVALLPSDRAVLEVLAAMVPDGASTVRADVRGLALRAGFSRSTVAVALVRLEHAGWIRRTGSDVEILRWPQGPSPDQIWGLPALRHLRATWEALDAVWSSTVAALAASTGLPPSTTARHLDELKEYGFASVSEGGRREPAVWGAKKPSEEQLRHLDMLVEARAARRRRVNREERAAYEDSPASRRPGRR
jgi:DNA-binding IclR family transcriptional regulator